MDVLRCHFHSDTVLTATTNGHVHPSDTVQILSLLTLTRCPQNQQSWVNLSGPCWVSGEREMLKDRTWLCCFFQVNGHLHCTDTSPWTGFSCRVFADTEVAADDKSGVFAQLNKDMLKESEKLLYFPNVVKSKWPHFSFWITQGLPEVAKKTKVPTEISAIKCA